MLRIPRDRRRTHPLHSPLLPDMFGEHPGDASHNSNCPPPCCADEILPPSDRLTRPATCISRPSDVELKTTLAGAATPVVSEGGIKG